VENILNLVGAGLALMAALMVALWAIHLAMKNASIVDLGWAAGLAAMGLLYAWLGVGDSSRKALAGATFSLAGLRLAVHLAARILGHPEEGRYVQLRKEWGSHIEVKFLGFFLFQALIAAAMSLPVAIAASDGASGLRWNEFFAAGIWSMAWVGEWVADAQLARFKRKPANKGRTCRDGLWRYSRHPNYFFQWILWVSYALFATASPYGWLAWFAPAAMLFFLFRVTGIPATEEQALRSRGADYRSYQGTTSAFVPWFPKAAPR
jgi:steroid 5-alpha reductase family enzyme